MNILRGIFFGLVQLVELPVNLILELWRTPGRGRGLLFGFPSVFVLALTLLAIGWAKYGSNQELLAEYWRTHQNDRIRLATLNGEINDQVGVPSTIGEPDPAEPTDPLKPPASDQEDSAEIVKRIQREIFEPRNDAITGNPRVRVRVELDSRRHVEKATVMQSSGFEEWDNAVRNTILKTGVFTEFGPGEKITPTHELEFGYLETLREKLLYTMIIGLKKLIDLEPFNPIYKYEYAVLSAEIGNMSQARLMMDQVASPDKPGHCAGHVWQTRYIMSDKKLGESLASKQRRCMNHLRLALAAEPTNIEANEGIGELYFTIGNFLEAEKHFRLVWEKQLSTTLRLAEIYKRTRDDVKFNELISKSKARLEEALAKDPDNLVYVFDIERICLLQEDRDAAIATLNNHLNEENKDKIYRRLARQYTGWAQAIAIANKGVFTQEAFDKVKKSLEYEPKSDEALWLLTVIGNQGSEMAAEARALYDPVRNQAGAPALVLREYAGQLIAQGRTEEAITWLENAYQRFSKDPVTANNLAYLLITADPPNPERSLEIITKAIDAEVNAPSDVRASLYDTKATALIALQRPIDAIPYLEATLQYRVHDTKTITSLRECYLASGQTEAADFYQRLLDEKAAPTEPKQ